MSEPTPAELLETVRKKVLSEPNLPQEDREALERAVFIAKSLQKKKGPTHG